MEIEIFYLIVNSDAIKLFSSSLCPISSFLLGFLSHVPAISSAGAEPGTPSWSPAWVADPQVLESFASSRGAH